MTHYTITFPKTPEGENRMRKFFDEHFERIRKIIHGDDHYYVTYQKGRYFDQATD